MVDSQPYLDSQTAWVLLAALGLLWILLGLYWGKRAKSAEGFMVAGRNVGLALGTATAMATWVTSNTTMLAPQFALQLGIWGVIAYSTASFGLLLFAPLAQRIRELMPKGFTSGDFIRLRYGTPTWILFLLLSIFYSFTWLVSMGMAGGILLEAIAHIQYEYGMSVILLVCVVYTVFGGMYAVIGTDFIQSLIILFGIFVVGVGVLYAVPIESIYTVVLERRPMLLNALMPAAILALFNNLLFGIGEVFHSNVWWSRAFAMRESVGRRAYLLSGLLWAPIPIAAGFIALASDSLGINIGRPDMAGPVVAAHILGSSGVILVFCVFFCSLASSIDSLLAATSDLITEDLYRRLLRPNASEEHLRKVSVFSIIGLGSLAWVVCLPQIGTLATVLFFAGPLVGSMIWPIASGLFWKEATSQGAFWGMVLGSVSGLLGYWYLGWYTASLIGASVSMMVTILARYIAPANFHWAKLNEEGT